MKKVASKSTSVQAALKMAPLTLTNENREEIRSAVLIHRQAIAAADKFHSLYTGLRKGSKGTTSHDEQDLLRAMLVFSCSGLDAVVKQLVQDALAAVVESDDGAQQQFQKFVERRIKRGTLAEDKERNGVPTQVIDINLLARVLVDKKPREALIGVLTDHLVADSLQSKDQLLKVAAHFALTKDQVMTNEKTATDAFKARNEIIHEMDVDLDGHKKRRQRTYKRMVTFSENMAAIGGRFISEVEKKLPPENT